MHEHSTPGHAVYRMVNAARDLQQSPFSRPNLVVIIHLIRSTACPVRSEPVASHAAHLQLQSLPSCRGN